MYYLTPTREWLAFRSTAQPPQKLDANGHGMVERFPQHGQPPRPLLDFTILPDTVSFLLLTWIESIANTSSRFVVKRNYGG